MSFWNLISLYHAFENFTRRICMLSGLIKHILKSQLFILSQPTWQLITRNHLLKNQMDGLAWSKRSYRSPWNTTKNSRPSQSHFLYRLHDESKRVALNFKMRGAMISGFRKVGCDVVTASVMVTVYETANCWAAIVNICGVQHMERPKEYYGARVKDQIKILKKC